MNRTNTILAGLLVGQLALLGATTLKDDPVAAFQRSLVVEELVAETVTSIRIEDGKETVELTRSGPDAPWLVASQGGWRADDDKVDKTLGEVLGLETADLISTTDNHHVDLKVADAEFERKLTLTAETGTKEVLFGTSAPGSGVHVRRAGDTDVFAVRDFSTWKLGTGATSWIDRTYLAIPRERVASITVEDGDATYALAKDGEAWTVAISGAEPVPATQSVVDSMLGKLEKLTLSEVTGRDAPAPAEGEVTVSASVTGGDDGPARTVNLRLVPKPEDPPEDGEESSEGPERWFVRADSETHTVEVGRWAVRPLVEIDPAGIVAPPPVEEPE